MNYSLNNLNKFLPYESKLEGMITHKEIQNKDGNTQVSAEAEYSKTCDITVGGKTHIIQYTLTQVGAQQIEGDKQEYSDKIYHNKGSDTTVQITQYRLTITDITRVNDPGFKPISSIHHEFYITSGVTSKDEFIRKQLLNNDNHSQFLDMVSILNNSKIIGTNSKGYEGVENLGTDAEALKKALIVGLPKEKVHKLPGYSLSGLVFKKIASVASSVLKKAEVLSSILDGKGLSKGFNEQLEKTKDRLSEYRSNLLQKRLDKELTGGVGAINNRVF